MMNSLPFRRVAARVVLAAALLLVSACSTVTQENYDKLAMGMNYSEVIELLGEPGNCKELMQIKQCLWGNDEKSISINFVGNKVVLFSNEGLQ